MRPHGEGGTGQGRDQAARTGRCQTLLCGEGIGEGTGVMEGTMVGGDRDEPYAGRTTKRLTGGAGLPAGVSTRERAAGRWGRLVSERERERARSGCARVGAGRQWAEGGGGSAGARGERLPRHGLDSAQLGGFLFFFLFSNSYIHFLYSFSF
jgi:hypothetical protein